MLDVPVAPGSERRLLVQVVGSTTSASPLPVPSNADCHSVLTRVTVSSSRRIPITIPLFIAITAPLVSNPRASDPTIGQCDGWGTKYRLAA